MARLNKQQLLVRQQALEEEIRTKRDDLKAIASQLSAKNRAEDTRRKIVLGAAELAKMAKDERYNAAKLKELSAYLTRDDDRKLFGLLPLPVSAQAPEQVAIEPAPSIAAPLVQDEAPRVAAH